MSHNKQENYETLNAFIDGQLATDERMQIFESLKKDAELSHTLCELQRNDEFLSVAFNNIPAPKYDPYISATQFSQRKKNMLAASVLFIISAAIGWQFHTVYSSERESNIQDISFLNTNTLENKQVLIHVSKMDPKRITDALNKAESLLKNEKGIQLEIVANAEGLGLLRENSPYAKRIKALSTNYNNVSFKACGIAIQAAKLREGKDILLLPEADKVPAALDQILDRLKAGWVYIKA